MNYEEIRSMEKLIADEAAKERDRLAKNVKPGEVWAVKDTATKTNDNVIVLRKNGGK